MQLLQKFKVSLKKNNFLKVSLGIFLLTYGVLTLLLIVTALSTISPSGRHSIHETTSTTATTFMAEQSPTYDIDEKMVAAKTNLQRKVLPVSPGRTTQEVAALAQQYDAIVIKEHANSVVVEADKAVTEKLQTELVEAEVITEIEVDYPVFISSNNIDWGVARIEAPEVWETTAAEGILVAVLDTGIDYSHPDLVNRYAGGYNVLTNTQDAFDDHGHGTHVAGIIAADLNEVGLTGVSPQASLYAIKVLSADGTGYLSDLIEGIDHAIEKNAAIINFSLGTTYDSSLLESKLQEAAAQGIFMSAAAGNSDGDSLLYPAGYDSVVAVSATDESDNFASFSSLGAELVAPGVMINSTVPGGGYAQWSGTSMAAPHVSATAALMMSNEQENIRQKLRDSAIDLGPPGKDSYYGYGLVYAKPAALGIDVQAPLTTFISPEQGSKVKDTAVIELNVQDENLLDEVTLFLNNKEKVSWTDPDELLAETYFYQWDTSLVEDGTHTWLIRAVDEYQNQAEVKLELIVNQELETDLEKPADEPVSIPAREKIEQGEADDVRRDIEQEPAEEKRQDYERMPTAIPTEREMRPEEEELLDETPYVTNFDQRNPKSDRLQSANSVQDPEQDDSFLPNQSTTPDETQERVPDYVIEKDRVRGIETTNWWSFVVDWFRQI